MKVRGVAFHQPFPLGGTNRTLRAEGRRKDKCKETLSRGSRGYFVPAFLMRQLKTGNTEDWQRSIPGDGDLGSLLQLMRLGGGSLQTLQLPRSLCQTEQQSMSHLPLCISQVSPRFPSLRVSPPRRARQLSSLPQRLLPGFKSQSKLQPNNMEQISSTAFPPHEYFIRQLGAKPVGGGIKLTARTHEC